uniref:hypothetical protein n=1 Tax=Lysinibacillus sp. D4B1_S16 TaxID=2941231 RepID=UPI0020BEF42E
DHNIVKYRHNGKLIIIHFDINLKHTVLSVNQDPWLNNSNNLGILEDAVKKERIKKMLKR